MYFMAKDIQDRAKWLVGLAYYRKEAEKCVKQQSDSTLISSKRMSSIIELAPTANAKRSSFLSPKSTTIEKSQ